MPFTVVKSMVETWSIVPERVTVKTAILVPLSPSVRVTLAMETDLSCVLGREAYLEYAREIHEKYGCPVDCPELRAAGRGKALRLAHLKALLRIAPDYAKLLERQHAERARFLVREKYAELASDMFRWRDAREKRRAELIGTEGQDNFEGLQRFLACVRTVTSEKRLLRFVYLARREA